MSFWPEDIVPDDIRSPGEIMEEAAAEFNNRTERLSVAVGRLTLEDRAILSFRVLRPDLGLTLNLLDVQHRVREPYPAAIVPPESDIPEFLQKRRYVEGFDPLGALQGGIFGQREGRYVENEWVCATPDEFSKKLRRLLSGDYVRSKVLSLLAAGKADVPVLENNSERIKEEEEGEPE